MPPVYLANLYCSGKYVAFEDTIGGESEYSVSEATWNFLKEKNVCFTLTERCVLKKLN